jgi:aminoglycoside/choline kinase family phosphotransferase
MESIAQRNQDQRLILIMEWIQQLGLDVIKWQPMADDASFRRYFRVQTKDQSYVVMDAKPPEENAHAFCLISQQLRKLGLNTPEIFASDFDRGFLLLSDFGDHTYIKTLNASNADHLYGLALSSLALLQTCRSVPGKEISEFSSDWMWKEWRWFQEWVVEGLFQLPFDSDLNEPYSIVVASAINQPQVFMHRDYHSGNLMCLPNDDVGILDFQDAFIGPVTYDLVSLLRDCYIDWPPDRVMSWVKIYWQHLQNQSIVIPYPDFLRCVDLMSVQRHLKALMTFARKSVRDNQSHYLQFMPRTLNYLLQVTARYPELTSLHRYLNESFSERVMLLCAR